MGGRAERGDEGGKESGRENEESGRKREIVVLRQIQGEGERHRVGLLMRWGRIENQKWWRRKE